MDGIKTLSFWDEAGNLKDKEEVMKEFEAVYDNVADVESGNALCEDSFLGEISDPENQIDVAATMETYDTIERILYLTNEITSEHSKAIFTMIQFWNKCDDLDEIPPEERVPIKLFIDTPGGEVTATFTIIDTIKASVTPVHTYTIGSGYSGGFFIGICGHKRFGAKNSTYMYHEGSTVYYGDAHKFNQYSDFYKIQQKQLKEITLANTKITADKYENIKKDDLWLNAETAKEYGVIDEIMETLP